MIGKKFLFLPRDNDVKLLKNCHYLIKQMLRTGVQSQGRNRLTFSHGKPPNLLLGASSPTSWLFEDF
jgi:hypothetical protein